MRSETRTLTSIDFSGLQERTKVLSLSHLHFSQNTLNILEERGVYSLEQLLALVRTDFDDLKTVNRREILQVLTNFHHSLNAGEIDWFNFWKASNIKVLPVDYPEDSSSEQIFKNLSSLIKEILTFGKETDRDWRIIQRRFGLDGAQILTLDQLGQAFNGLSRERIRQIESSTLTELREVLLENKYVKKQYHIHPKIIRLIKALFDSIAADAKDFILETELIQRAETVVGAALTKYKVILTLLFNLFGLREIKVETYESTPIWAVGKNPQIKLLEKCIGLIDGLLTDKNLAPMDEFDVLVNINKELPKGEKIDALQLHKFLELCGSIEKRQDNLYQGKFEFLKTRSHQAERILSEAGEPLHVDVIVREVNNRLAGKGKKIVNARNIGNIMSSDGRFLAIGSSGLRGLNSWENVESKNIHDLMEECLISLNRPATEEEIHAYISERRPVKIGSIQMYLEQKDIFAKTGYKKWGLASWAEAQDALVWSPIQVANFVAKFFREKKVKEIEYKLLARALAVEAKIAEPQARGMLKRNPVIKSRRENKPFKIFAIFNPSYKTELTSNNFRVQRKKETKYQKAEKIVREIIEAESTKQVELSKLVRELTTKHRFHEKTAYGYISKMNFVEKINLPEAGTRICRIKNKKDFSLPQIEKLKNFDAAKAEEAEKAVMKFTLDEIDIGLFMFGRLFENTLKEFLKTVERYGSLPVSPGNYTKLNNMIQWIESQGIISDKGALNYLRHERNDRAHEGIPKLEERKIMLESAPWVAGLYLNYIVYFENEKHKLVSPKNS